MKWTKENMFEPSGCLTREAFEALVNDKLSANARALADEHMASCPFCSDALEGFLSQKKQNFTEIMVIADNAFDKILAQRQNRHDKKRTIRLLSISIAASILLMVGLFFLINTPTSKMQMAESLPKKDTVKIKPAEQLARVEEKKIEKEKKPAPSSKEIHNKPKQNTVKFTAPVVVSENESEESVSTIEAKEAPKDATAETAALKSKETGNDKTSDDKVSDKIEESYHKKAEVKQEFRGYSSTYGAQRAVAKKAQEAEPGMLADEIPQYPGGEIALKAFINQNLQYPKQAVEMSISGRVFVSFMVEEDGTIRNIKVIRGLGGGCDDEAIRIIKLMPKWIPGRQNGHSVKSNFTLPIIFNLQNK